MQTPTVRRFGLACRARTVAAAATRFLPLLLVVPVLVGCAGFHGFRATNCSGGKCVTTSVGPVSGGGDSSRTSTPASAQPEATRSSEPAATPTATPSSAPAATPTATPSSAPAATPSTSAPTQTGTVASVQNCLSQFPSQPKDTLVSFTTSNSARQDMAACLQIPPQTMALFLKMLLRYAYQAYIHGWFNTQQGVRQFTSSTAGDTLPAAVDKCQAA